MPKNTTHAEDLYEYAATITRVVDGDTVDAMIDVGFCIHLACRIRLIGINTPEKRGKTRELGLAATEHMESMLSSPGKIHVVSHGLGKFGRLLGVLIHIDRNGKRTDLNQQMIQDRHALPYEGGKRSDADFLTEAFLNGRDDLKLNAG